MCVISLCTRGALDTWSRGRSTAALDCLLANMLVVHWAKQNKTSAILAHGIRPSYRRRDGEKRNPKGVYVYPFSRHRTLIGNWRRNLKTWDTRLGNYNAFIFRLAESDFPLIAGYWYFNRSAPTESIITNLGELSERYSGFFSGEILNPNSDGLSYAWEDFEIIIPRRIKPRRILKILKDREPKSWATRQSNTRLERTRHE